MHYYRQIQALSLIIFLALTLAPSFAAVQPEALTPAHGKLQNVIPTKAPEVILQPHGSIDNQIDKPEANQDGPVEVELRINVPHWTRTKEHFVAYPYPPKPPPIKKPYQPLPEKPKKLKSLLLATGYRTRRGSQHAYPHGGWRWRYAYNSALRHAGGRVPHTIIDMYPWTSSMVKYILPEVKRINAGEERRQQRYFKALTDYNRNHTDLKTEAIRTGLYPIGVHMYRRGAGRMALPEGTWWIVGNHKVPGLTYYWQIPVTVEPGRQVPLLTFTEQNALLIEGGW